MDRPATPPDPALADALSPFLREFDRLEADYGFDRPGHQVQCVMVPLADIARLRAAASAAGVRA